MPAVGTTQKEIEILADQATIQKLARTVLIRATRDLVYLDSSPLSTEDRRELRQRIEKGQMASYWYWILT